MGKEKRKKREELKKGGQSQQGGKTAKALAAGEILLGTKIYLYSGEGKVRVDGRK